mgnify:CR=1 FL=1
MDLCGFKVGLDQPFFLIAGPCVIESEQLQMDVAGRLQEITRELGILPIFGKLDLFPQLGSVVDPAGCIGRGKNQRFMNTGFSGVVEDFARSWVCHFFGRTISGSAKGIFALAALEYLA